MSTPVWGLPYPAYTDPGDVPAAFDGLATAADAAMELWLDRWQSGNLQVTLGTDVDRAEQQVTFGTPYTELPVVLPITTPAAVGSRDNLFYVQVSRITLTGFWVQVIYRNDPPKLPVDTVDVGWFSYGVI